MARAPLDVNPDASNPTVVVTHVRAGTGHWTLARNYAVDITSTSHQRVHSHRATSCRKPPQNRACHSSRHTAQASRLKILPRSRRTFSSCRRQATVSHWWSTSSGPFTPRAAIATSKAKAVIASNLSFGSGGFGASSSKAHPPHVSLLSQPGTRPGIRPVIRQRPAGGPVLILDAFLLPFSVPRFRLGRAVLATEVCVPALRAISTAVTHLC